MIEVILSKNDVYMGKQSTKTYPCATEDKARSRAYALAMVNKVPASMVTEKKDADGALLQIIVDASPAAPHQSASSNDEEIQKLKDRVARLEGIICNLAEEDEHGIR